MTPFQAFTRWLTPWRTIRRLEAEVVRLKEQTDQRAQISNELAKMHGRQREELATAQAKNAAYESSRLRNCPTHGQQPPNDWGCPECVRELRGELATAREAMRRLMTHLMLRFDDITFVGVYRWYQGGMTGPLPPLPDHMVNYQPTTEDQL
jgi:hypothetical protein